MNAKTVAHLDTWVGTTWCTTQLVVLLALIGCTAPFTAPSDMCSEGQPGYASYAYFCGKDGIYECHAEDGALSMCDQAATAVRTCGCDTLTVCGVVQDANGAGAVACVKRNP